MNEETSDRHAAIRHATRDAELHLCASIMAGRFAPLAGEERERVDHELAELVGRLAPERIYDPVYQQVYRLLLDASIGNEAELAARAAKGPYASLLTRARLMEIAEASVTMAYLPSLVLEVSEFARAREALIAAKQLVADPFDPEAFAHLSDLQTSKPNGAIRPSEFLFTAIAHREPPPPIAEPLLPKLLYPNTVNFLVGDTTTGKSTLALACAMAMASGRPPWPGAPSCLQQRVLHIAPDESYYSVRWKIDRMARWHFKDMSLPWQEGLDILARDESIPGEVFEGLRFTQEGIASLEGILASARERSAAYGGIVLDAYQNFMPPGVDNENAFVAGIMPLLLDMAIQYRCFIWILDHSGHDKERRGDPRHAARGASAKAQMARANAVLTLVEGMPHMRKLTCVSNDGPGGTHAFDIRDPKDDGDSILYFRPGGMATRYMPRDILTSGESASQNEVMRRIFEMDHPMEEVPKRFSGALVSGVKDMLSEWEEAGLIFVSREAEGRRSIKISLNTEE